MEGVSGKWRMEGGSWEGKKGRSEWEWKGTASEKDGVESEVEDAC
jgi:hypothetical protein